MDFGIYPPEINSGRMYTGPGAGPMLAAASAWNELATELQVAAESYTSAISELRALWSGPSSTAMVAAAAPYATWLHATAARAEDTAARAQAAVSAYEAAFAATVPPPVIAANRSLLMALVATNFFGQNTPAIAATEAQYAEMWAQDAAAMYGYAGSSASATTLPPFDPPRQNTDPGGVAGQAAAVAQAAGPPAIAPQAFSAVPSALQSAATAAAPSPTSVLTLVNDLITIFATLPSDVAELFGNVPFLILSVPDLFPTIIIDTGTSLHTDHIISGWDGVQDWPWLKPIPPEEFPAIITNPGSLGAPSVSAALGQANSVGAISVPQAWTVAAPAVRSAALTLPAATAASEAEEALEAGSGNALSDMTLGGMAGASMGGVAGDGAVRNGGKAAPGTRVAARAASPGNGAAGESTPPPDKPRTVVTGVAARIREISKLRNEGKLTEQEYAEEKSRLLAL